MKKRPFVLFEIMIALGLAALLLTMLARFFVECVRLNHRIEETRSTLASRQRIQTRLGSIFTTIVPNSEGSRFCTSDQDESGLVIAFDHGIDPDPKFSGPVIGLIFIDQESNLSLAIWPQDKQAVSCRKEVLCERAQNLQFKFLAPKQSSGGKSPPFEWKSIWPKTLNALPPLVRVSVVLDGQSVDFAFAIPCKDALVSYQLPREAL